MSWTIDQTMPPDVSAAACSTMPTGAELLAPAGVLQLDEAQQPEVVTADRYQPSDSSLVVDTLD